MLGEQLESVHVARQRAQAAYDLFDHYNQLSRGDTSSLEALKKEGKNREGTRQVAIILRRLNVVAKEVDVPGADVVRLSLFLSQNVCQLASRLESTSTSTAKSLRKTC
jgi:hypothetical protein